jgi:hypothetical protein
MAETITRETKREGQRKVKRRTDCRNQKRGRASPSRGRVQGLKLNLGLNPETLQHITVYKIFCHYFGFEILRLLKFVCPSQTTYV